MTHSKKDILDRAYSLGYENEQKYGVCPQCVLAALDQTVGGIHEDLFQASHTLAGGGAITCQGTCGALAGGMMAIATRYGRSRTAFESAPSREPMQIAKQLYDRFIAEFGSPICAGVQRQIFGRSFDLWDPDEFRAFEEAGGHVDKCPHVVGITARWTAEILLGQGND